MPSATRCSRIWIKIRIMMNVCQTKLKTKTIAAMFYMRFNEISCVICFEEFENKPIRNLLSASLSADKKIQRSSRYLNLLPLFRSQECEDMQSFLRHLYPAIRSWVWLLQKNLSIAKTPNLALLGNLNLTNSNFCPSPNFPRKTTAQQRKTPDYGNSSRIVSSPIRTLFYRRTEFFSNLGFRTSSRTDLEAVSNA